MPRISPRGTAVPAVAAVSAMLVLCSCSSGAGAKGDGAPSVGNEPRLVAGIGTAEDSAGPAPAVEGARRGGTLRVANLRDASHLDPQKIYAGEAYNTSLLWGRQLTQYQVVDGKAKLVGDLATDTGKPSDGSRTWTYRLKDGIAWEDGKPITAQHVKYGIERTFAPGFELGPPYWPQWLTGKQDLAEARKIYGGPKKDGDFKGIETPDDKTIVFHFAKPQSDVPFMAAQSSSSPVRPDKDTGTKYDVKPFATGPYRIVEHQQNRSMTLERNPHWKAATDPIRHQYADTFEFTFEKKELNTAQEILNGRGDGADTVTTKNELPPELYGEATRDPAKKQLVVDGRRGAFTYHLVVRNDRVPDPEVRKAVHYLFPRQQARQALGGPRVGDIATTYSSPAIVGYQKYDTYPVAPTGDIKKAKEHLAKAGKPVKSLTYAYESNAANDRVAQVLVEAFGKAGITLVTKPMPLPAYTNEVLRSADPKYDLWMSGSSVDWPTPATGVPYRFDSRRDSLDNDPRYKNPAVDKELDRIAKLGDATEKAKALVALEKNTIMKDVPLVPFLHQRVQQPRGANVGGAFIHPIYGTISPAWLYLKKS
ncbi:ABC transporter substrate-binding protein [Streptomyces sp. NPDC004732]|uniref:ABC transporter substrate-binding protein n=1 Tax=Streptomyces sp. NPDC004732 TaxID=3154290 RepID=UPI0033B96F21